MKRIFNTFSLQRLSRRLALVLCVLTALAWYASAARAGSFDYTVVLDPSQLAESQVNAPNGETYLSFEWSGLYSSNEIGSPQLPVRYLRFLVPTYCNNISATCKSSTLYESRDCSHLPYPAQPPVMTNGSLPPEFVAPAAEIYSSATDYPAIEIVEESFVDGFHHVVTVAVSPLAYNGERNSVSIFSDITLSLSYDECTEDDMDDKPIFPKNYTPFFSLDDNILDPANIRASNARHYSASRANAVGQQEYYYVITPASLKNALSDFVTWKRQKGYTVVVKTIESILETPKYKVNPNNTVWDNKLVDEAASLRAYLRDEYESHGFFYCLLVGNYRTSMPIRKSYRTSSNQNSENSEAFVPTDVYFTDLKQKWDLTKCPGLSIYSCPSPSNFNPSICTGRLLCSTSKEIENWFYKVKLYEANPGYGDMSYLTEAIFFEQWSYDWETKTPSPLIGDSKNIRNFLHGVYFNCDSLVDPSRLGSERRGTTGKNLIDKISKTGFSSWHGHGTPPGVACSWGTYYITSEDSVFDIFKPQTGMIIEESGNGLNNIRNMGKPSIAYSISCDNTPFDCLTTKEGYQWNCRYNMGESFTVANKTGGPVFLGNSRVGYITSSANMELWFFKGLVQNRKIGYAENYSKLNYGNPHLRATHSIIGDSEIEMWLGKPVINNVSISQTSSSVSFSGTNLSGSKICVYDGEGNYATGSATSNSFNFSLSNAPSNFDKSNYMVSVWKTGSLPVIKLFGQNATMTRRTKTFIVRDAMFGSNVMKSKDNGNFTVGASSVLNVKAIDNITTEAGFIVDKGGAAKFECDWTVSLKGGNVKSGGSLEIRASDTTLQGGFTVNQGGTLTIYPQ